MEAEDKSPPPSSPFSELEEEETTVSPVAWDGGDGAAVEQVMSEVHLGCPPGFSGPHISHFSVSFPPCREIDPFVRSYGTDSTQGVMSSDEDGDLVLPRRRRLYNQSFRVTIQHSITSSIPRVGLQVWRAELVLADFVLHKMSTSHEFDGIVSLELGAGTGLVGILLARVAETVFLTDHGDEILENCEENVQLNSRIYNNRASVFVRELDWKKPWPPRVDPDHSFRSKRYRWTNSDFEKFQRASLLVAADVIYSDDLTGAFFTTLDKLMSHGLTKVLYLALEKRYNFSLSDLDVVANGYARFLRCVTGENGSEEEHRDASTPRFVGRRIDLSQVPQYVSGYDRGTDVEIWQICTE